MPSKLRKAIGAVKDQTSISLAKVSATTSATTLGVTILKTTTHDEVPIDDRHVQEILLCISSNKAYAAACAQAIGKRISRTRNWIVAVKSLMLVLRIFQQGDPHFPREVLHATKRGCKILNLSSFKDDSISSPWDYTAFVRTFALYLDERLDCLLAGKFHRRTGHNPLVHDMKPGLLLDQISAWQRLLDRAIATQPTGAAKSNRLVQISVHAIVQESFDLYRDISDALALLLDSFFHLQYQSCVNAFQACIKASKQYEDLSSFYSLCKTLGIGRSSEYPSIQKVSDELIQTLQEFLKDQSSFPAGKSGVLIPFLPRAITESEPPDSNSTIDPGLIPLGSSSSISLLDLNEQQPEFTECWELALLEPADKEIEHNFDASMADHHNNPFLGDSPEDLLAITIPEAQVLNSEFAFHDEITVAPTFCASNPNQTTLSVTEDDPFESSIATNDQIHNGSVDEQTLWQEQELWLQNQNKIIAKHFSRLQENH